MSTTVERIALPGNETNIRVCGHCGNRYDWRKSPSSSLKMTFCGTLCERAELGFTIEALLQYSAPAKQVAASTAPGYDADEAEALTTLIAA